MKEVSCRVLPERLTSSLSFSLSCEFLGKPSQGFRNRTFPEGKLLPFDRRLRRSFPEHAKFPYPYPRYPAFGDRVACHRGACALVVDADPTGVLRRQYAHFFCVALCRPLVQSLE